MKIKVNTKKLENLLLPLQAVISDNHIIPVLQNVKLEFNKKELIATGDNTEIACRNSIRLKSDEKIEICANFSMLLSIVKSLNDETITLIIQKNELDVEHSKGVFSVPIFSTKEFSIIQIEEFDKKANINATKFKTSLKVANRFVLNDDVDAMANISISIGKNIYIRSTDRHRLFEEKIQGSGDEMNLLLSGKASNALFALIEDSDELEFKYNSNKLYFKFDDTEIIVTQQKGNFPIKAFTQVVDNLNKSNPFKLDVKEFITSLKRVSLMTSKDKYQIVKLSIGKKSTLLTCKSENFSTSAEEFVESKFPEKKVVGYDYKYLVEILSVFEKMPKLYIHEAGNLFLKSGKAIGIIGPTKVTND